MMASSSVSQESLDHEDDGLYATSAEFHARQSRIRIMRAKGTLYKTDREVTDTIVPENDTTHQEVSPNRLLSARGKEKRSRPSHLYGKGKLAKDKRKLREKRRSTGVQHLPSTESTGDSLDEDDEDGGKTKETHVNTEYNVRATSSELKPSMIHKLSMSTIEDQSSSSNCATSKSPSDADADLEDNQEEGRVTSDSSLTPKHILSVTPKPPSFESKPNGYPYIPNKPLHSANRDNKIGSRVHNLAASFTNRSEQDTRSPTVYSPIGYSSTRRNDSPRWSPKPQTSPKALQSPRTMQTINDFEATSGILRNTTPSRVSNLSDSKENVEHSPKIATSNVLESRLGTKLSSLKTTNYITPKIENRLAESAVKVDATQDVKKLQEENLRLQQLIEEKDAKISLLELKIADMEKESTKSSETLADLEEQNATLLRAIIKLTAQ